MAEALAYLLGVELAHLANVAMGRAAIGDWPSTRCDTRVVATTRESEDGCRPPLTDQRPARRPSVVHRAGKRATSRASGPGPVA